MSFIRGVQVHTARLRRCPAGSEISTGISRATSRWHLPPPFPISVAAGGGERRTSVTLERADHEATTTPIKDTAASSISGRFPMALGRNHWRFISEVSTSKRLSLRPRGYCLSRGTRGWGWSLWREWRRWAWGATRSGPLSRLPGHTKRCWYNVK